MTGPIFTSGPGAGGFPGTAGRLTTPAGPIDIPDLLKIQPGGMVPVIEPTRGFARYQAFNGLPDSTSFTAAVSATTGDPFGSINTPTGGFVAYTTDTPLSGTGAVRFSSQATAGSAYAEWGSTGTQPLGVAGQYPIYANIRLRAPVTPPDTTGVPFFLITDSATAFQVDVRVNSTGNIVLRSGAGAVQATSTNTVTIGSAGWFGIRVYATRFDTTTGAFTVELYNATTGATIETLNASGIDTLRAGGSQKVLIGQGRSVAFMSIDVDAVAVATGSMPVLPPPATWAQAVEVGATSTVTGNTATVTTGSFTPASSSLLIAYCAMGNGAASASSLGAVTDTLGGTWTRLAGNASANGGVAEIWACDVGTAASMQVTYDPGGAAASGLALRVGWFTGAKATAQQPGAVVTPAVTSPSPYAADVPSPAAGSVIVGALGRATDQQTPVAYAGTSSLGSILGSAGDTAALFRSATSTTAAQPLRLGYSNNPSGTNVLTLTEVAALVPSTNVSAGAEQASGTGQALDASAAASAADQGPAVGTGQSLDGSPAAAAVDQAVPTGSGLALDGSLAVAAADQAVATGAGSSLGPVVDTQVAVGLGAGAGASMDAVPGAVAAADQAAGASATLDGAVSAGVTADQPAGAGQAYDPTVSTLVSTSAAAEVTSGAGQAFDATVASSSTADQGAGGGTAINPTPAATAAADQGAGSGTALGAAPVANGVADQGAGTGQALDASTASVTIVNAPAEASAGGGSALDALAQAMPAADQAPGAGIGLDPGAGVSPFAGSGAGVGASLDASTVAAAGADQAAGVGASYDATTSTAQSGPAGVAAGNGQAPDAGMDVTATAGPPTGTGGALDPTGAAGVSPALTAGAGQAPDATGSVLYPAYAGLAAGSGLGFDAQVLIVATAWPALAFGSAMDPTALIDSDIIAFVVADTGRAASASPEAGALTAVGADVDGRATVGGYTGGRLAVAARE